MLHYLLTGEDMNFGWGMLAFLIACLFCFFATLILNKKLMDKLPRDLGRAFAVNGELSKGKARGAGIIFVTVFALSTLLFVSCDMETVIYMVVVMLAMLSGFFDDAAKTPWGEYKKGIIDFVIAIATALTFVHYNTTHIYIRIIGEVYELPKVAYVILAVILIWVSINVINCTDGVDGLCGSIAVVSLLLFAQYATVDESDSFMILSFVFALGAYLWFNAKSSVMLMGDAGSRAIGLFMAIVAMKSGSPLLFVPFCLVFILDGGLGLVKIIFIRFLKLKNFLKNTKCPLHDHARKVAGWSDEQTVLRFVIIQLLLGYAYMMLVITIVSLTH